MTHPRSCKTVAQPTCPPGAEGSDGLVLSSKTALGMGEHRRPVSGLRPSAVRHRQRSAAALRASGLPANVSPISGPMSRKRLYCVRDAGSRSVDGDQPVNFSGMVAPGYRMDAAPRASGRYSCRLRRYRSSRRCRRVRGAPPSFPLTVASPVCRTSSAVDLSATFLASSTVGRALLQKPGPVACFITSSAAFGLPSYFRSRDMKMRIVLLPTPP